MKINELEKSANERIDIIFQEYPGSINEDNILIATIGIESLFVSLLGEETVVTEQMKQQIIDYLKHYEIEDNLHDQGVYSSKQELAVVQKVALVGLAAAAIGASSGLVGQSLHPILVGIVGAEAAVTLNLLSAYLQNEYATDQDNELFGLDLAVISILESGQYTVEEASIRLSKSIDTEEINQSIKRLLDKKLIKEGVWPDSYTVVD